jgi:hypothetical protein
LRVLLLIVVPAVLLLACALIVLWIPLPGPCPPAFSDGRNLLAAIVTGVLGIGSLVGLAVTVVSSFLRAGRGLDPALETVGLVSERYLAFGRRYRGVVDGRDVEVTALPGYGVRSPQLDLRATVALGFRMAVGRQRPLLDCRDCPLLILETPEWVGFQIYAEDAELARRLLEDPASAAALQRLMDGGEAPGLVQVYVQPERIWLRVRAQAVTGERVQRWFDDLLALAEAGERAQGR